MMHAPMFMPRMIGIAEENVTLPVAESACRMPTEAEELWMTAVMTAPVITPRTGLLNSVRICVNSGSFASGATAPLIVCMPNMRIAKPSMIVPTSLRLLLLEKSWKETPIIARTGENEEGFRSCTNTLSPWMPERLRIQAVMVVPRFAPMMTPVACESFMMPELTKPTTITVVAAELCIIAVTAAPRKMLLSGFAVSFSKMMRICFPARFSIPSPMTRMP